MHIYLDGLPIGQRNAFQLGRRLSETLNERQEHIQITHHINFNNQNEFSARINEIIELPIPENRCTLTLACHGFEGGLKVNGETDTILWGVVRREFLRLKERFRELIIILAVCEGSHIEPFQDLQFVYCFTYKISLALAINTASLIIDEYMQNLNVDLILTNARLFVKENEDLIKLW